jgi:hypothetical protein
MRWDQRRNIPNRSFNAWPARRYPTRVANASCGFLLRCSDVRYGSKAALTAPNPNFRGRDASYLAPPAQIRASPIRAHGSHLGYVTARRDILTKFRMRFSACDTVPRYCARPMGCGRGRQRQRLDFQLRNAEQSNCAAMRCSHGELSARHEDGRPDFAARRICRRGPAIADRSCHRSGGQRLGNEQLAGYRQLLR